MSIQFDCPSCGRQLRTPDGTEGKQAKCPQCGTLVAVPVPERPPVTARVSDIEPVKAPFSTSETPYDNPYASPQPFEYVKQELPTSEGRSGPPWENPGPSLATLIETVRMTIVAPTQMFSTMRLTGNLGSAFGISILVTLVFHLGSVVFQLALTGWPGGTEVIAALLIGLIFGCLLLPIFWSVYLFAFSGLSHGVLRLLQANTHPYETTLRTMCYANAATGMFRVIPLVGSWIASISALVYVAIGLTHTQNASGLKAVIAVIVPGLLCMALGGLLAVGAVMAVMAG